MNILGDKLLKIIFGSACIVLTIILLIFLLPQTIFPNNGYFTAFSTESTYHEFVSIKTDSIRGGCRFRNYGRNRADTYVFFANIEGKYLPVQTTAHILDANVRSRIKSFMTHEYHPEMLSLEGRLATHGVHVQSAIDEFINANNADIVILPYALRITTIGRAWGDIILGIFLLITPSIFGAWMIIKTVRLNA